MDAALQELSSVQSCGRPVHTRRAADSETQHGELPSQPAFVFTTRLMDSVVSVLADHGLKTKVT